MKSNALLTVFGMALQVMVPAAHADTSLPALNSYGQPPFVIAGAERPAGLARTFIELMNAAKAAEPHFHLENLPRRRLEVALGGRDFAGIALFLAPEFFAAPAQQGGVWSAPVMVDENLIVSVRPLKLSALEDLNGLRLGGIAGHIYGQLATAIHEGRIEREDAMDHVSNLNKLCLGRVDFVIISRSELAGTQPLVRCQQGLQPMAFPDPQVIVRRVLVRMPGSAGARGVLDAVAEVACGEPWAAALSAYGLSTVGCRHKALVRNAVPPEKPRKGRLSGSDEPG